MLFRRRRRVQARIGMVAAVIASTLLSLAPAAARVIYCISDAGHSGFELVASGERRCASCCHDQVEGDGLQAAADGCTDDCTDVSLTLAQDLRQDARRILAGTTAPVLSPLARVATWPLPARAAVPAARARGETALAPPRSAASSLVAFTVLTI